MIKSSLLSKLGKKFKKLSVLGKRFQKPLRWLLFILIPLLGLSLSITLAYHLAYYHKIYPQVYLKDILLSNLTPEEAQKQVSSYLAPFQEKIMLFTYNGKAYRFTQSELGISYNVEKTVKRVYGYGRDGSFLTNTVNKWYGWFDRAYFTPSYDLDENLWADAVGKLSSELDLAVSEPHYLLSAGQLGVSAPLPGRILEEAELRERISAKLTALVFDETPLPVKDISPRLSREDLIGVQSQVASLIFTPLRLIEGKEVWELTPGEILNLLTVEKSYLASSVSVNKSALGEYIRRLAQEVYVAPKGELFTISGDKVLDFSPSVVGRELDEDVLRETLTQALLDRTKRSEIVIPIRKVETVSDRNKYGIRELIGEGKTSWGHSSSNRIHNIVTASQEIMGALIPPGEVFSLAEVVGEVSKETGYKEEYVIKKGETILEAGGGLCQVSTTIFRAALQSGLPITERLPHAYRVGYYEPPLGFDATVYPPSVDLKFKNDTPAHLLLWASWDIAKGELTYRLYGTSDGRQVAFEGPFNKDYVKPPEPRYIDDPTLPKGETKQKEREIQGVTTEFYRNITWIDGHTTQEVFKSKYQPWQAVFLVGTRE